MKPKLNQRASFNVKFDHFFLRLECQNPPRCPNIEGSEFFAFAFQLRFEKRKREGEIQIIDFNLRARTPENMFSSS